MKACKPYYPLYKRILAAWLIALLGVPLAGQTRASDASEQASASAKIGLDTKVAELDHELRATREELAQSREEIRQLRLILERLEQHLTTPAQAGASSPTATEQSAEMVERVRGLEEGQSVMQAQIEQQEQTKVASISKYPLKLTGLILFNTAFNRGNVDNLDVPELAFPQPASAAGGAFSATLRQSIFGLEATGPTIAGARSSANAYVDFFGGFPNADFGVTAGLLRLRTARLRLDWPKTSLVFAQESPFFSALSPTSLATLGQPALSWAGNLWSWTPQVRIEHALKLSSTSSLQLQGGILDPIDSSLPVNQSFRKPTPGEQSRQPGYAARVAWTRTGSEDRPMTFGLGGFYSSQRYPFDRHVTGWAGTADWKVPFGRKFELSGEAYRGNAVGGLGGGQFASFVANGDPALSSTRIAGLNSLGVWGQLKYRASSRLEFNGAVGHDNPFASDLERFPAANNQIFARNQTSFLNFIFTPESSLLFSLEFRHIQSYAISGRRNTADQINIAAGYSF